MLKVYTRSSNDTAWTLYGEMTAAEWQREQANIAFLRSMGPLYVRIDRVPPLSRIR